MSLRSPLSRVLGSGSAKEGTEHWWMQRLTAVAMALLGAWFIWSIAGVSAYSHADLVAWVGQRTNAVLLVLLSITLAWHSMLGVQVVIEDYVHGAALKVFALMLNKFTHVVLATAGVLAVLKVALGGSA